jgi:hypothetical protein
MLFNEGTRSRDRHLGDGSMPKGVSANHSVSWTCDMLVALHAASRTFTIKNPARSSLCYHPRVAQLVRILRPYAENSLTYLPLSSMPRAKAVEGGSGTDDIKISTHCEDVGPRDGNIFTRCLCLEGGQRCMWPPVNQTLRCIQCTNYCSCACYGCDPHTSDSDVDEPRLSAAQLFVAWLVSQSLPAAQLTAAVLVSLLVQYLRSLC